MAKNIIFCADGTWNGPDQDENDDDTPDHTNVFKLFLSLLGQDSLGSLKLANEQEKELVVDGSLQQVAKYIHGVGDSRNLLKRILGGVFGSGVITRITRGYTFISRHYQPGDNIVIVGFSRGAYTARALAGLIAGQGLLARKLTKDKERAYRAGAQAWYQYRRKITPGNIAARILEITTDLPAFISQSSLKNSDFVKVKNIHAVGVWDTVGSLGFPDYNRKDKRVDAFKFANRELSKKVTHGFHAVALDERRADFTPTLWKAAPNVTQTIFPGAHADVGGGYPTNRNESGLSDGALQWMMDHLKNIGVLFAPNAPYPLKPDPCGTAHQPWRHSPWTAFPTEKRNFPRGIPEHPSVAARAACNKVVSEPGDKPGPYRPKNRPTK